MALARSVSQEQFDAEYQRIKSKRNAETALLATLDFVSAVSTSLVLMDMVQLIGFEVSMMLTFSAASMLFFGLLGITIFCGVLCAIYMVQEGRYKKNAELNLMQDCFMLAKNQTRKLQEFKIVLEKLLKMKDDPFIRARYNKIINNEEVDIVVREVNGYIKTSMQERFSELVRQQKQKQASMVHERVSRPNYWLSNVIAFFSGAGLTMGISASIIGASTLPALLLTPLGWTVLAVVLVVAIAVGIGMAYSDYQLRQSQQTHIEALEEKKHELFSTNKCLDKTALRVEEYMVVLSLQSERPARSPDETLCVSSGEQSYDLMLSSRAARSLDTFVSKEHLDESHGVTGLNISPIK